MIAPVVDLSWWQERRDGLVTADVRWYLDGRSGRAAYDDGHLPGAVFVDLDHCLAAPGSPEQGRHPLPDPDTFAACMGRLGIGDDDVVVAYDDAGGVIAARLVWMLRVTGHAAALLDGGMAAYPGPLSRVPAPVGGDAAPAATFSSCPWPADRLADIDDAADAELVVVDARSRERYRGDPDPVDPRPGHIPGARSLPCREQLDDQGRWLSPDELRRRFATVGVGPATPVVSYCGSGVTACHTLLGLERAGLGPGRLYPGSWSQYGHATDRPAAVGDDV